MAPGTARPSNARLRLMHGMAALSAATILTLVAAQALAAGPNRTADPGPAKASPNAP